RADAAVDHAPRATRRGRRPEARGRHDDQRRDPGDRDERAPGRRCRERCGRGRGGPHLRAAGDRRRRRLNVSVVSDAATTSILVEHRPWWRSRITLPAAIVGAMLVAYFGWKAQHPWPASLT